jgi:transcription elongation factor GreA
LARATGWVRSLAMSDTELSPAAHARLQAELEDLTTRGRVEVAAAIERARELGDLSENADYHAAREDQGRMEARIRQIQRLLDNAVIVEAGDSDEVKTGTIVSLRYEGDSDVEQYLIGSIEERNGDMPVISPASPLGRALLGRRPGETVEYEAPSGMLRVEVVELSA